MNVRIGLEYMVQGRESGTVMQVNGSDLVGIPFLSTAHKIQTGILSSCSYFESIIRFYWM